MRPISSRFALPVALVVLLSCKGSESSTGPSGGFAPTSSTTVSGNVTYTSVNIPAGVTVTFSADAVVTVSGDYTQAGTVSAPCHALTLAVTGNVTITGAVANDCSDPNADGTPLRIVGQTSYTFTNATITSSGDVSIVNDPGRTLSASMTPSAAPLSASAIPGIAAQSASGSYRCNLSGMNITTTPPKKKKGANGSPAGSNGAAGAGKYVNCGYASTGTSGGSMLLSGTTINGGSGGDGGDGTSATSTPSQGGDGGPPGAINISADNDIVMSGTVNINGGNGGKGGMATSAGAAGNPGVSVTANGGKGGGLKPASGAPPVSILAKGSITQSGTINFTLGAAGAGGDANANAGNGLPGNPGARGGDATANGGNGGASTPVTMNASGATTLNGTVNLNGGAGGAGGASNPSPGNGGDGNAPSASGGRGGDAFGRGGAGGVGNPPGALVSSSSLSAAILASLTLNSPGGNGGDANLTNADGGAGSPGCPTLPGGNGGGGNANGGDGAGAAGTPAGNHGHTTITGFGNGNNGASGVPPGALGPAGIDNTTVSAGSGAAKTVTNSFKPGLAGGPCPGSFSMIVTPATQTEGQGSTGSVHVVITRNGTFSGAVTLSVTDQGGATRGTATISASSTSTDVPFTVPSNALVGANTWTVTGSGTSVSNVTQTFSVTVSQTTGTTASVQYCGAGTMVWAGLINGATGTPQNVPIVNGVATFTMTQSAAIYATTFYNGTTYQTDEYWGSASDVATWASGYCASTKLGSVTQAGTVRGLSAGQFTQATIGTSSAFATQPGMGDLSVSFLHLNAGTSDGFATVSSGAGLQEMLILRNIAIPSSLPVLFDFTNGFAPSPFQVLYTNEATRMFSGNTYFWSPTGPLDAQIGAFTASGGSGIFNSVPATRMGSSDLIVFNMFSISGDDSDIRGITNYFHTPGNMTVNFPGILNVNISRATTSAPVRLQATGSLPTGLNSSYLLTATQGNNTENWYIASSFPGFGPTFNWTTPDWTSAGFQASWGMQPGSNIVAGGFAYGYTGGTLPADGAQRSFSGRTISVP